MGQFAASESWLLSYAFTGPASFAIGGAQVTSSGDTFTVLVAATTTAAYTPGRYEWIAYATKSGERHQAEAGVVYVQPNAAATATAGSVATSHAVKTLALIEAEIERRLTGASAGGAGAIESYAVGNRQVHKLTLPELKRQRAMYRAEVWRERNPGQLAPSVQLRFRRASA